MLQPIEPQGREKKLRFLCMYGRVRPVRSAKGASPDCRGQTLLKLCKLFRKGIDKEIDGIEESTLRKIRVLRIVKRLDPTKHKKNVVLPNFAGAGGYFYAYY